MMPKDKRRKRILSVLVAVILLAVLAFFVSGYAYFIAFENTVRGLSYGQFFVSLFTNEQHRRIFQAVFLLGLFAIAVLVLKDFGNEYKSDKKKITDDLYIPEQAGQLQYGSARFMDPEEKDRNFETEILPRDYQAASMRERKGGIIVGYEKVKAMRKPSFQEKVYFVKDDVHSLILGATRSGKQEALSCKASVFWVSAAKA